MKQQLHSVLLLTIILCCNIQTANGQCSSTQFSCDGTCISTYRTCDGVPDCTDGADESLTICDPYSGAAYLIVSDVQMDRLYYIEVTTGTVLQLPSAGIPRGVDIDPDTQDVYYLDNLSGCILKLIWSSKVTQTFYNLTDNLGIRPEFGQLKLVKSRGVLYYTVDINKGYIGEVALDGSSHRVINQDTYSYMHMFIHTLNFDTTNNYLYVSVTGGERIPGIYKILVTDNPPSWTAVLLQDYLSAVSIDFTEGKMYFMTSDNFKKQTSSLDGSNLLTVRTMNMGLCEGMVMTPNQLYYSDSWDRNLLCSWEKYSGDSHCYAEPGFVYIKYISSYGVTADVCMKDYEHCTGSGCVYRYHVCDGINHCSDGSDEDPAKCPSGKKAYMEADYLVALDSIHGDLYQIDPSTGDVIHVTEASLTAPRDAAIDPRNGDIYYVEMINRTIMRFSMTSFQTVSFATIGGIQDIVAIAIDPLYGLLYLSCNDGYIDEFSLLDGTVLRRVFSDQLQVWQFYAGLEVIPIGRKLCYMGYPDRGLSCTDLNDISSGSYTAVSITSDYYLNSYTADPTNGEMFWMVDGFGHMEKCYANGSNRQEIYRDGFSQYWYMTNDPSYIYFIDMGKSYVRRINRVTYAAEDYFTQVFGRLSGLDYYRTDKS